MGSNVIRVLSTWVTTLTSEGQDESVTTLLDSCIGQDGQYFTA